MQLPTVGLLSLPAAKLGVATPETETAAITRPRNAFFILSSRYCCILPRLAEGAAASLSGFRAGTSGRPVFGLGVHAGAALPASIGFPAKGRFTAKIRK